MKRTLLALGLIGAGCSSGTPVSPVPSSVNSIESAHVLVAGVPVEGTTVTGVHGSTMFQVRVSERDAAHLAGVRSMTLAYDLPGMGGSMMRRTGETLCYDDGTHGDDVAGDGVYHRADEDDSMGCGGPGSPMGSYGYTFHCRDTEGRSCGDMMLSVTRS